MKTIQSILSKRSLAILAAVAITTLGQPLRALPLGGYTVTNLVSNLPTLATNVDPSLINPWGLTFDESGDPIVADNGDNLASFYAPDGTPVPFTITAGTKPTGIEYNADTNEFMIGPATNRAPASLLICTESGTILGFSFAVSFNAALVAVDDSSSGAVFTGLTVATVRGKPELFVADFHNDEVRVFDGSFKSEGSFTDRLEEGYAPFNVRNIGGFLFVTFAKRAAVTPAAEATSAAASAPLCEAGLGNGFVDIFTVEGQLVRRLIAHGNLNAPWGITYVPIGFGRFTDVLLVGNNGDGHINVFDAFLGNYLGTLNNSMGQPLTIPGLWSLNMPAEITPAAVDNCENLLNGNLYFTAGLAGDTNGVLGLIQPGKH